MIISDLRLMISDFRSYCPCCLPVAIFLCDRLWFFYSAFVASHSCTSLILFSIRAKLSKRKIGGKSKVEALKFHKIVSFSISTKT